MRPTRILYRRCRQQKQLQFGLSMSYLFGWEKWFLFQCRGRDKTVQVLPELCITQRHRFVKVLNFDCFRHIFSLVIVRITY